MQVSHAQQEQVVARFLAAVRGGDLQALLDVLAPDVVAVADGGGLAPATRRPLVGHERVGRAFSALAMAAPGAAFSAVWLNGAPGARIDVDGELHAAVSLTVEHGRITRIYAISNPHKLARLGEEARLSRAP
jgi:RNA polymerase sigma-70 factor (ECF subfamily)